MSTEYLRFIESLICGCYKRHKWESDMTTTESLRITNLSLYYALSENYKLIADTQTIERICLFLMHYVVHIQLTVSKMLVVSEEYENYGKMWKSWDKQFVLLDLPSKIHPDEYLKWNPNCYLWTSTRNPRAGATMSSKSILIISEMLKKVIKEMKSSSYIIDREHFRTTIIEPVVNDCYLYTMEYLNKNFEEHQSKFHMIELLINICLGFIFNLLTIYLRPMEVSETATKGEIIYPGAKEKLVKIIKSQTMNAMNIIIIPSKPGNHVTSLSSISNHIRDYETWKDIYVKTAISRIMERPPISHIYICFIPGKRHHKISPHFHSLYTELPVLLGQYIAYSLDYPTQREIILGNPVKHFESLDRTCVYRIESKKPYLFQLSHYKRTPVESFKDIPPWFKDVHIDSDIGKLITKREIQLHGFYICLFFFTIK